MSSVLHVEFSAAQAEPSSGLIFVFLLGRLLFSAMFIMSGFNHLFNLAATSQAATSAKIPAPKLATVASGLVLIAGGFSVLLGAAVREGTALLVAFLVPTAFIMHRFWGLKDAAAAQNQLAHFLKNLVMAGAALMFHYFTALCPESWIYSIGR